MKMIKRLITSFILLYTFNLLSVYINLIIPINIITLLFVYFLGLPGFVILIVFRLFL
ncbi:MAG: pro-sigmaK processing inhibitor BofA family protein [Bacilli bacterium]|nr:pro-sigmaK processing inhibitor BofA family protein [Bacilli bacterium]